MSAYDVVVIGGGIIGAATLHALTQQGRTNCLLLEQGAIASGATGFSGGIMRVFHRDPWLSDLTAESMERFRGWTAESGQALGYVETGAVYVASTADRDWVQSEVTRLQAKGVAIRLWDAAEARRELPAFQWRDDDLVVHEPHAGYADPVKVVTALLDQAQAAGASVATGRRVTALRTGPQGVVGVETDGEVIAARSVVLAAGAWSSSLLHPLGLGSSLYAKSIQVNRLAAEQVQPIPCWLDFRTLGYGRSSRNGEVWFGAGLDERPVELGERPCRPADAERARALAIARMPALQGAAVTGGARIADAYTTDRRGLLGEVPEVPGLVLATGWGGTGFMIALAIGEHVASTLGRKFPLASHPATAASSDF